MVDKIKICVIYLGDKQYNKGFYYVYRKSFDRRFVGFGNK